MASLKLKLGRLIPEPAEFTPTRTVIDDRYIYSVDLRQGVCRRRPKHWDDQSPAGYYQVSILRPAQPAIKSKPNAPASFLKTIKNGVLIPTLVTGLVAGLVLVLYPLLPGIKYQVQKQLGSFSNVAAVAAPETNRNRLIIPKIGVDTTILEGPSLAILNKQEGVWHQTGAIADNLVIAGHRFKYLPPNTSTFYNLGDIQVGDTILVDWYGVKLATSADGTPVLVAHG